METDSLGGFLQQHFAFGAESRIETFGFSPGVKVGRAKRDGSPGLGRGGSRHDKHEELWTGARVWFLWVVAWDRGMCLA